jgi:hypothetical protein
MASRRQLKKQLKYTYSELYFLCAFSNTKDENANEELINKLIILNQDTISRISHTDKKNAKAYYKNLFKDINEGIEEIFEQLS